MVLHVRRGAHLPEHGKHKGDNGQEAQRQDPEDVQNVRDSVTDGTRDSTAHARSPRPVDLVASGTGGQEAYEQDHAAEGTHRGADNDKGHLECFDPQETEVKHSVQHNDDQTAAPVHGAAEDGHADEAHDGGD